ncbi:cell division protein FtsQ [Mycolicibacillus koreensis]|uniref:Cell division protein FtsQ n=1 Tax=Mycolicibacillus koreensis TaxID=1069220 RepID=A0AA91PGS4_9MYCO|nr:cell division protein FtsQ/DivIB [Mycolicibacillus koreensis]OSC35267.1 cell division protein FtsQ [Mycolicibacillus koreensis]
MTEPAADDETVAPADDDQAATPAADDDEFEGPRRRARRERAERRAAQQRARAIEEARREAKRRLRGSATPTTARPVPRGAVRGLKMLLWGVLAVAVTVGLGLVLYFTPVMSVRTLDVVGLAAVTDAEVLDAAQVAPGTPLLQVDTDAVADRVATIRRVASARVQRQYPSTLRITIVERVPVAVRDFPDGPHLYDRDGVDFATGPPPPSLPYLDVATPGPTDPATTAALDVLTALRPEVVAQVGQIAAPSVASITLTLVDGRTVIWGTSDRTQKKADTLAALLTQPGEVYDVSSPDLPTVR